MALPVTNRQSAHVRNRCGTWLRCVFDCRSASWLNATLESLASRHPISPIVERLPETESAMQGRLRDGPWGPVFGFFQVSST